MGYLFSFCWFLVGLLIPAVAQSFWGTCIQLSLDAVLAWCGKYCKKDYLLIYFFFKRRRRRLPFTWVGFSVTEEECLIFCCIKIYLCDWFSHHLALLRRKKKLLQTSSVNYHSLCRLFMWLQEELSESTIWRCANNKFQHPMLFSTDSELIERSQAN